LCCFFASFWLDKAPTAQSDQRDFPPCVQEYLNFKGGKFSKSRGGAVEVPYFLSKYDPDALRCYLTAVAPETRDTEFAWEDFVERNNPCPESQRRDVLSADEGNELVTTARLRTSTELSRGPRAEAWGNLANAREDSGSC
jgi:hypothetical protein